MNSFERKGHPAKSYELNVAASLVSRHNNPNLTEVDRAQLDEELDQSIDFLSKEDIPLLPRSDASAAFEFSKFVSKVEAMLTSSTISDRMSPNRSSKLQEILRGFEGELKKIATSDQLDHQVSKLEIEKMFGLQSMWERGEAVVRDEISRWAEKSHPAVPEALLLPVEIEETERLIEVMKTVVLGYNMPLFARIALINNPSDYNLFWSLTMEGSEYVTPASYTLDTHLSYDLPHTVAHLAHLSRLRERGVQGYIDDMATRAFFESVAVFSEYQIVERLAEDSSVSSAIRSALSEKRQITAADLGDWIKKDRNYEFNLRNARLLADLLAVEGAPLKDIVHIVSETLGTPFEDTYKEVTKYFPWTGLGAIYTLGYRDLQESGVKSVGSLLSQEDVPTTWNGFRTNQRKTDRSDD
jgi:hypothetical protein